MKISYNWLKDYLDFDIPAEELSDILTNIGLEVEGVEYWSSVQGGLEGVVVGEVMECGSHPNADKLSLTKVDAGTGTLLSIVCGAPNVAKGQKVAVAMVGTTLFYKGREFPIKKAKIRGELSEGMICAEDELGIGDDHEGIIELPHNAVPGRSAAEYLGVESDVVFEIGLTPNRIDGGSHYGVARDLAAWLSQKRKTKASLPRTEDFNIDNNDLDIPVKVENTQACPRYTGVTISGLKVQQSPEWLKNRLRAIGLSPINNIVDITNFVLHECGQPLHAFDADKITGKKIIVRNLPDKTKFTTLDEEERELSSSDLMICNTKKGMCIGGVFGGLESGVTESTKAIFLESAYFDPVSIRKTARRHALNTDASFRFERGVDPALTTWALKRAALLIKEIAGGKISSEIVDIYPKTIDNHHVKASIKNIWRLVGKRIQEKEIIAILESLEIKILESKGGELLLEVPAYRVDVRREADIVEEILRIYGYNNIDMPSGVRSTLTYIDKPDSDKVINTISEQLAGFGFTEIMSNSLNPAEWYKNLPDFDNDTLVRLTNPLSSDLDVMRQSLIYGGLAAVARNINRQNPDLRLYELGTCYFRKKETTEERKVENYIEEKFLDFFVTGNREHERWNDAKKKADSFTVISVLEFVLERMGLSMKDLVQKDCKKSYFDHAMSYLYNNKLLAEAGKLSDEVCNSFDIKEEVYYGHIKWDRLFSIIKKLEVKINEIPRYPSVRRDLALLVDKTITFARIRDLAYKTEKDILRDVDLFDVYESDKLGKNKKSYAVSFILRDDKRTLTDKVIDKIMKNLVSVYQNELGAIIR